MEFNGAPTLDTLTEVFRRVQVRDWSASHWRLAAPWGLRIAAGEARLYFVEEGECRLEIDGSQVAHLRAGDMVLLPQGREHRLCDIHRHTAAPLSEMPAKGLVEVAMEGDGEPAVLLCGSLTLHEEEAAPLLSSLPPLIHIPGADGEAAGWLAEVLRLMDCQSEGAQPGQQAIVDNLAQVVVIQAVRSHVSAAPAGMSGWLAAMMDPDIGTTLRLMHAHPERSWTVAELADRVCLSRSVFAARFKAYVRQSPMQYLMDCRMRKACTLLRDGRRGIKEIAAGVGYASGAAFSSAFKRWSGTTPGDFRRIEPNALTSSVAPGLRP